MLSLKKLEVILKHLEPILKAENDNLKEDMGDEYTDDDKDLLITLVDRYETALNKALIAERKRVLGYLNTFIAKDINLAQLMAYIVSQMEKDTSMQSQVTTISETELENDIGEITPIIMNIIDKDVGFTTTTARTSNWITNWSNDLGQLMKLNTVEGVERALKTGVENGHSIQKIQMELETLPQFSRTRARTTAITEVLTAHSASHYEAYKQSPAVTGKKWKHSGGRKNNPRKWHVDYSGTEVDVDEFFTLKGEKGMYPRDPRFSARNRVRCHCAMGPVTDPKILSMKPAQKQKLQKQKIADDNKEFKKYQNKKPEVVTVPQTAKKRLEGKQTPGEYVNAKNLTQMEKDLVDFTAGGTAFPDISTAMLEGRRKVDLKDVTSEERTIIQWHQQLENSKHEKTLYRIEEYGVNGVELEEGNTFTYGFRSFTKSPEFIDNIVDGNYDIDFEDPVVFRVKNAKSINIEGYSTFEEQRESITAGTFEIESVDQVLYGESLVTEVTLKQLDTGVIHFLK